MQEPQDNSSREILEPANLPSIRKDLLKRTVPMSLIPLATANGMLVLGSHKISGPFNDCYFPLPEYLVYTGSISLAVVIVGVVARYIVGWILNKNIITRGEKCILNCLENFGLFLIIIEIAALLIGSVLIYPHLTHWQYSHKNLPNYCDYSIVMFSSTFIGLALFFITFGGLIAMYLIFFDRPQDEVKARPDVANV